MKIQLNIIYKVWKQTNCFHFKIRNHQFDWSELFNTQMERKNRVNHKKLNLGQEKLKNYTDIFKIGTIPMVLLCGMFIFP
jgi:hypothetical protein